jgi:radical SAM superfamily enzyme YgiQ (UPF0313 family)
MIKKVILFGDFHSKDYDDWWAYGQTFFKTSSLLRIAYYLRSRGVTVKQVHHCTRFSRNEIDHMIDTFSAGDPVVICISSSFMNNQNRLDYGFHTDTTTRDIKDVGDFWGKKTFKFLLNLGAVAKKYKFPVLMGGFDIAKYRFTSPADNRAWGLDALNTFIDYYIMGNNPGVILEFCKNQKLDFESIPGKIKNAKLVYTTPVTDFRDFGFMVSPEDNLRWGEALTSEIAAGCVFSCSFCTYSALGKKKDEYHRTYESVKNEFLNNYNNFGVRTYMLVDNIINDNEEKMNYLIRFREETGINLRWAAYARLDTIKTKRQAQMFKDAGCIGLVFGIESLKKEVGPYLGKITDKEKIVRNLYIIREALGDSAILSGSFISGAPTETKEELNQTYEWLKSDEGRYLLDHWIFTPMFLEEGINERTEINKARNNPYKDYIRTRPGSGRADDWISPWGTYEEFLGLAIRYSKENNVSTTEEDWLETQRGVFAIPYMNNVLDGDIEEYVRSIRAGEKIHYERKEEFKEKNQNYLEEYKKRSLGNYYSSFEPEINVTNPLTIVGEILQK